MIKFDDLGARMSLSTMQGQISRPLAGNPDGILFDEFFAERSNTSASTPAAAPVCVSRPGIQRPISAMTVAV